LSWKNLAASGCMSFAGIFLQSSLKLLNHVCICYGREDAENIIGG
jgi:hypothetical protein